jgi:hypothetical protein
MTTAGPDGVLTAADLLFGSSEDAHEALTRHVMASGRSLARALVRLPRMTREAAVREAAVAAAGLLKVDLMDVLVAGWREHRDIYSAARRTLATPGSKELVGLAPHRVSTVQQPAVSILVDGHRVHTLQLGLSIIFEVTGLVAGVSAGRLAGVHAGRGEIGVALTIHELEVLTKRSHLELPGAMALKSGFRLLAASEYPDEGRGHQGSQHPSGQPGSQHPSGLLPGTEQPGGHFPGVDLMDGHFPAAELPAAELPAAEQPRAEQPRAEQPRAEQPGIEHPSGPPVTEHPGRGEADHPAEPWWQKAGTRADPPGGYRA